MALSPSDTIAARKAAQEAEARGRNDDPAERDLAAAALDLPDDGTRAADPQPEPVRGREEELEPRPLRVPEAISPHDRRRSEINARYRQERQERAEQDQKDAIEDMRALGLRPDGLPLEFTDFGAEPEPEPAAAAEPAPEPEPAPAPRRMKVKVRGEERELSEDELIAAAQRGLAGDSYFDDAKAKSQELDEILRSARDRVQRADPPGTHPAGDGTPTRAAADAGETGEHPASPFAPVIEKLTYGGPEETAQDFQSVFDSEVDKRAQRKAQEVVRGDRIQTELRRSQAHLTKFAQENPELLADENSQSVVERGMYRLQAEDLAGIGYDFARFEKENGRRPSVVEISNWHRDARADGFPVRSIDTLLNQSKTDFLAWRGVKPSEPEPEPARPAEAAAPKPEPKPAQRVEVAVDRSARRAALQPQPSRTVAPRPDASVPRAPVDINERRSQVVQGYMEARKRPHLIRGQRTA